MMDQETFEGKVVWPLAGDWKITFADALMTLTSLSYSELQISLYAKDGNMSQHEEPSLIVSDYEGMGDLFFHLPIGDALSHTVESQREHADPFSVETEKQFEEKGHPGWVSEIANHTKNYRLIQRLKDAYDEWKINEGSMTAEQLEAWDASRLSAQDA